MSDCISPNGPYAIVEAGLADARSYANGSLAAAGNAITGLGNFELDAVNFNIDFDEAFLRDLTSFRWPNFGAELDLNDYPITYNGPAAPPAQDVHVPVIGAPPVFTDEPAELSFPAQPGPLDTRTFAAPDLDDVNLPAVPTITLDDAPTLTVVNLDDLADLALNIPTFSALTPSTPIPDLELSWDYTNAFYGSALVTLVKNTITDAINNGSSLPAAVEDALFERADGREEINRVRSRREIDREFAARGFQLPPGALVRMQNEVTHKTASERSALSREIYVTRRTDEVETRKHYLAQGIAIETQLINDHIAYYERSLQAGRIILDASVALFNAKVQRYNVELEIFKVEVLRFQALIEAELAKVEELKAELEIRSLRVQINQQEIERYIAHVQGVNALINIYIAQVSGAEAVAKVNTERVAAFAAEVDAYRAEQGAKESEYRAWGSAIQGELGKVQVFEAQASAFGRRVDAFKAGADVEIARTRSDVDIGGLRVQEFQAKVDGARAEVEGEIARLEGAVAHYVALVRVYEANIQGQTALAQSHERVKHLAIQQNKNAADVSIASAQLQITQSTENSRLILEALKAIATATSNLAAGAMAATNVSAAISGASSDSRSCSGTG